MILVIYYRFSLWSVFFSTVRSEEERKEAKVNLKLDGRESQHGIELMLTTGPHKSSGIRRISMFTFIFEAKDPLNVDSKLSFLLPESKPCYG